MLPESLLFVFRTPFVRCNMGPRTVCTFGLFCFFFWASFVRMILSTDDALLLRFTILSRVAETLTVEALSDRNRLAKFLHLVNNSSYIAH